MAKRCFSPGISEEELFSRTNESIIAGDFNAHNPVWSTRTTKSGKELFKWADRNDVLVANRPGQITRPIHNIPGGGTSPDVIFSKDQLFWTTSIIRIERYSLSSTQWLTSLKQQLEQGNELSGISNLQTGVPSDRNLIKEFTDDATISDRELLFSKSLEEQTLNIDNFDVDSVINTTTLLSDETILEVEGNPIRTQQELEKLLMLNIHDEMIVKAKIKIAFQLPITDSVKYLGVYIDNRLRFDKQLEKTHD